MVKQISIPLGTPRCPRCACLSYPPGLQLDIAIKANKHAKCAKNNECRTF